MPSVAASAATPGDIVTEGQTEVVLPAGVVANELLIAAIRVAGAGAVGWPAGWTEILEDSSDTSDDVLSVAWRKSAGVELGPITVTHGVAQAAALSLRIINAADPLVLPPQISVVAIGDDAAPNPPSLAPTGGAKDYLWIALSSSESGAPYAGYPANFPHDRFQAFSGQGGGTAAQNCRIACATLQENVASKNPDTFSLGAFTRVWAAVTIAVHPPDPTGTTAFPRRSKLEPAVQADHGLWTAVRASHRRLVLAARGELQ